MVRVFEIPGVFELKTFFLFKTTAVAEIIDCYLPYLWLWCVEGIRAPRGIQQALSWRSPAWVS
jgi:drug/metabolite transporter superfamily protein YnfA